jgi:hypothetical protein
MSPSPSLSVSVSLRLRRESGSVSVCAVLQARTAQLNSPSPAHCTLVRVPSPAVHCTLVRLPVPGAAALNIDAAGGVQALCTCRLSPVIGAADHLYNNSIGQCTETRYIYSAQIPPPPHNFLDG